MSFNRNRNALIFWQRCTLANFCKMKKMLNSLFSWSKLICYNLLKLPIWQVQLEKRTFYRATVTDHWLNKHWLNTLLDNFPVDLAAFSQWTQKKNSWAAESFFHSSQHMWKGLRILLPLSKQKSELTGVLEGAVTTPWVDLQGLVYEGLRVRHRLQRNLHLNQPGRKRKKHKN